MPEAEAPREDQEVVIQSQPMTSQPDRPLQNASAPESNWFDRFFRDSQGNIVIIQPPNLPILVVTAAALLQLIFPSGKLHIGLELITFGTLYTWAWLEIFSGLSYFRRSLGVLVLVSMLAFTLSKFTSSL
jgi:hypothetical protein